MIDRDRVGQHAHDFFEGLWAKGDPWDIETSDLTQRQHARLAALLGDRHYRRALEIGCGAGVFTGQLVTMADHVVAIDVAPAAIERARKRNARPGVVDYRVANVMQFDLRAEGPWDLVVMSEMIYFLGWLYPFFDVAWLVAELFAATAKGGRMLLANTQCGTDHLLLLPSIIRTYHDLFRNVGYQVEIEEVLRGVKDGVHLEILISRFVKPTGGR